MIASPAVPPMDEIEMRACIHAAALGQRALARHLNMGEGLIRSCARGRKEIPPALAVWLRELRRLWEAGPLPDYATWAAEGPPATTADHEALFEALRTLGWSIEELGRNLGIEKPLWTREPTVPDGAEILKSLLWTHIWTPADVATRFELPFGDPDLELHTGIVEVVDGREVSAVHQAKVARVVAVLDRAADLPATLATWAKQRQALRQLTTGRGSIPPALLRWLAACVWLYTTWPDGFEPGAANAMEDIDPLTGGSLA